MTSDRLLSVQEAHELSGLSHSHLANLASRGEIPARKVGRRWFFQGKDVEFYVNERSMQARPAILDNREALVAMYAETRSMATMGERIGCTKDTVRKALVRLEIPIQTRSQCSRLYNHREGEPDLESSPLPWPDLERWYDIRPYFTARGLRPPNAADMCHPDCPGRSQCLSGGACIAGRKA